MVVGEHIFSPAGIEQVRGLIVAAPELSRTALSRRVCEVLDWRAPDGRLKAMQCRVALLRLARRGAITLPAAQANPFATAAVPVDIDPIEVVQVEGTLAALGRVWLEAVDAGDQDQSRRWWAMMEAHHPLGGGRLCGAQLRYVVQSAAGCLGGLSFSAAAWRVGVRDRWIGWDDAARRRGLPRVLNNSRFLILPSVRVPHLASHVLALALRRVAGDWQARYGITPVLVETYTDPARYRGTCYRAANWQPIGRTQGRGRQDRRHTTAAAVKEVWLYPLARHWRAVLGGQEPAQRAGPDPEQNWAQVEFGACKLGDARLTRRLVQLAQDFYARPTGSIPQACGGDRAKTKAAYRLLDNKRTAMQTVLEPHYQATEARMAQHPVVLAVQDTTSLNYSAHPATTGLGPVGNSIEAKGLHLHSTLTMTPDGTPLGFIDAQCWAREVTEFGRSRTCADRDLTAKESIKWFESFQITAEVQARLPHTTVVNIGDREADIFELFANAGRRAQPPGLLVRAAQNRRVQAEQRTLWPTLEAQAVAGTQALQVPRQGSRAARAATLSVRFARVELRPPGRSKGDPTAVWAVLAREETAPAGVTPLEWMLLTTLPVENFAQAIEKLHWYARRWTIEVLHRILKSGCRIEDRQLESADRLEACLAIDLVVAWRIHHLTKLGRETPDLPCTVYFEDAQWKALVALVTGDPVPPPQPPTLRETIRLVAGLGGFLGRKGDGEPGTQSLWLGLQKLDTATTMWRVMMRMFNATHPYVSSPDSG